MEGADWLTLTGIVLGSLALIWAILQQQSKTISSGLGDRLDALATVVNSAKESNAVALKSIHSELSGQIVSVGKQVESLKSETMSKIASLESETKTQVESLKSETMSKIASLESETKTQVESLKSEMASLFKAQNDKLAEQGDRLTRVEGQVTTMQRGLAAAASVD